MNTQSTNRNSTFVDYLFQRCQQDKGFTARLCRGDNPATEYQSWETLAAFGVNLEYANDRLPFALITAAVARRDQTENGDLKIGQAIACSLRKATGASQGTSAVHAGL
ncbi:MAG TPA: hypothetical protein ACHBX0_12710 [Arsenophonus sp.]